ncbi:hypothetical protein LUZ60_012642 [Juncus effusus]|nr:hypothetical protein LUZ60_012642 [Juncus effusus]
MEVKVNIFSICWVILFFFFTDWKELDLGLSKEPFNQETIYIKTLDAERDISLLKHLPASAPHHHHALEKRIMCRVMCRENLKKESGIELILPEAEDFALPGSRESIFSETVSEVMDRYLDAC